ncbi:MAG: CotH kinase family protein, partial [Bacteroidales bacterium]
MKKTILFCILIFSLSIKVSAQSNFYDVNTIQLIEITFTQSNWDYMLDTATAGSEGFILASKIKINGVQYDSVGVKYKGNSSYNSNQVKNPFHIELDTYKNQDYQGFTDIKLGNAFKDPSFLREVLSYKIARNYMAAPQSNFANIYVNNQLLGLYSNSESVGKKFVESHFGSNNNSFFKCNPLNGAGPGSSLYPNLVYLGADSTQYYSRYELQSDHGWFDLVNFCDTLANLTTAIDKTLNVNQALWMLAFDNVLVNLDSYIGAFSQNYYLYKDDFSRFR